MKNILMVIIAIFSVLMFGCNNRIDGSSEENFTQSLKKVVENLSEDEKKMIAETLSLRMIGDAFKGLDSNYKKYDGMTQGELLKTTVDFNIERLQSLISSKNDEINEIKSKIEELQKIGQINKETKEKISKIKITNTKFYLKEGFLDKEPVLSFIIKNETDIAISKIGFNTELISIGRKVPWIKDDHYFTFQGGLNPNESQKLSLAPNIFSKWGNLEDRNDYILKLEVLTVFDENNKMVLEKHEKTENEIQYYTQQLENLNKDLDSMTIKLETFMTKYIKK